MVQGQVQAEVDEWLRPLLINFKNGIMDQCNIDYNHQEIKYFDTLSKISKLINGAKAISKGIVVGGYSQGGTMAADSGTTKTPSRPGSIVVAFSVVFDNSPSIT